MTDDWMQIQNDLRAGVYGDWWEIRREAGDKEEIR